MKIDENNEKLENNEALNDEILNDELKLDIAKNLENLEAMAELNKELSEENDDDLITNPLLEKSEEFTTGLTPEEIKEFYEYLGGRASRPAFADKFFADGDSRIKESNQLTVMLGLSFIPKLLSLQQAIINKIAKPETLSYKSVDELTGLLQIINRNYQ